MHSANRLCKRILFLSRNAGALSSSFVRSQTQHTRKNFEMMSAQYAFLASLVFLAAICRHATANEVNDINLAKRAATVSPSRNVTTSSRDSIPAPKTNSTSTNKGNTTIEQRAQANYANVVDELNAKFKGLKENCFPRPTGCLCVVGKAANGTEITERRMKDADCKCAVGQTGPECPAAGA